MLSPMTDLTPVGRLLEDARESSLPKPSQNEVARRAGTSGTTYRNVIYGFAKHGGNPVPYSGAPETVARFAQILGVESFQLREAGRADAADALQDLENRAQFSDMSIDEIKAEAAEIRDEIAEILRKRGIDRDTRQGRVFERWATQFAESVAEEIASFDKIENGS